MFGARISPYQFGAIFLNFETCRRLSDKKEPFEGGTNEQDLG